MNRLTSNSKKGDCDYLDSNSRAVISDIAINHTTCSSPSSTLKMDESINMNNLEKNHNTGKYNIKEGVSARATSPSTCSSPSSTSLKNKTSTRYSMEQRLYIMDRTDSSRELEVPLDDVVDVDDLDDLDVEEEKEVEEVVEVEAESKVKMEEEVGVEMDGEEKKEEEAEAEAEAGNNNNDISNVYHPQSSSSSSNNASLIIENKELKIERAENKRRIEQLEEQNEDLLLELASIKMSMSTSTMNMSISTCGNASMNMSNSTAFTGGSPGTGRLVTNRGNRSARTGVARGISDLSCPTFAADAGDNSIDLSSSSNRRGKLQAEGSIGGGFSGAGRHSRRATIGGASINDTTSRARVDNKEKDLSVTNKTKPRRRISSSGNRSVSMHNGGRRHSNSSTDDSDDSGAEFGGDGGGTTSTRSKLRSGSGSGSGTRPAITRTFSRRVNRRASACSDILRHNNQDDGDGGDNAMPRLKRTFSRRVIRRLSVDNYDNDNNNNNDNNIQDDTGTSDDIRRNRSLSDVETLLSSCSTTANTTTIDSNSANSTFRNNRSATRTTRKESQSSVRTRRSSKNLLGSSSMHRDGSIHCPDDGDCARRISASSKDLLRMFNEQ
jgi:hypothetical protein